MPDPNGGADPQVVLLFRVHTSGKVEFQWPADERDFWYLVEKLAQSGRAHYLVRNAPRIQTP